MSNTIFDEIRKDHEKQRTLLSLLTKTKGDSEGREELFEKVKTELTRHAEAEEKFFYVPLIKDGDTRDKARHSIHEHHEIDEQLEKLEETDFSSSQWIREAEKLEELVIHHLDEEEHEVFQQAGKILSETEKEELALRMRGLRNEMKKDD